MAMDFPILNPDEGPAIALIRRAAPAIFYHARRFAQEFGVEEMDLVQEAFFCLVRVITKNRSRNNYPDGAYPARRLRFAMLIYAMETCKNVRVPAYIFNEVQLDEISLSSPIGDDDKTLEDLLADEMAADNPVEERIDRFARLNSLGEALEKAIRQRDREVLSLRFKERLTRRAVAERMNLSTNQVKSIEQEALGKLRRKLKQEEAFRE
jgi:RNA polymerase sigma factor (sigma-70 family)